MKINQSPYGTGDSTPWGLRLPPNLELIVYEAIPVARPGPGGSDVFYWCRFGAAEAHVPLLVVQKASLTASTVPLLKARLLAVMDERVRLSTQTGASRFERAHPTIVTDAAIPSVVEACMREGVGLLDRRGAVMIHAPPVIVRIEGRGEIPRQRRVNPFASTASRIVRLLLLHPGEVWTARAISDQARAAYAHTYAIMRQLESDGFVTRRSPRSGFRLADPVRLMQDWLASGESSAVAVEGYYASNTSEEALGAATQALQQSRSQGIFTLASGLQPSEVYVAALPHGMYLSGDASPIIDSLGLRRTTPQNFFILRANPAVETDAGGIYHAPRSLPHGPAVSLPQLVVDIARHGGGRGKEQSEHLVEAYARSLPFEVDL